MSLMPTKEQIRERVHTCSSCEFLKKGFIHRCSACGCPIKTKVMLKSSECPKSKWFAIKE
jgi:uncharacterized Fe-S cluster-containing protein